jgi:ribosomal protein L11 methylase PrmA
VLLELLPGIAAALTPDGEAVLSGILLEERESMLAALAERDWEVVAEDVEGMWWTARITHR